MATKRKRPAIKAPDEEEWASHKTVLRELYAQKKLSDIITHMEREHGFVASKNQYERRFKDWGLRKNLTSDEWKVVLAKAEKRKEIRKESQIALNGVPIPKNRLKKEEARYALSILNDIRNDYRDCSLPADICISTPRPAILEAIRNIEFHNLPSFALMDFFSTPGVLRLFHGNPANSVQAGWSPLAISTTSSRTTDFEEDSSYLPGILEPVEDQSTIHENILPGLSDCDETAVARTLFEKQQIILREVGVSLLERHDGEIANRINTILGPPSPESLSQFTAFLSCLSSNKMIEDVHEQRRFLQWIGCQSPRFLRGVFALKLPALQACLEALLHYAVTANDSATFEILFGADTSKEWYHGRREYLLLAAVQFNLVDIVRYLCNEGTDVNCRLPWYPGAPGSWTPLGAANTSEIALILLAAGSEVDAKNDYQYKSDGRTTTVYRQPLIMRAIVRCQTDLVYALVDAGASYDPKMELLHGPQLAWAIINRDTRMFEFMLKMGVDCEDLFGFYHAGREYTSSLQLAAFLGCKEFVRAILKTQSGRSYMLKNDGRWAPLRDAAMSGELEIVELLISAGADVNAGRTICKGDFFGDRGIMEPTTPLLAAVCGGHVEVIKILLRKSVEVNGWGFSEQGTSALEAAELLGREDIIVLLSDSEAVKYPSGPEDYEIIELYLAARKHNLERVRGLVARGVDVSYILDAAPPDFDLEIEGVSTIYANVISTFINVCGEKINTRGPLSRQTALEIAMRTKQSTAAWELMLGGADLDMTWSSERINPLHWAIRERDFAMARLLVLHGAKNVQPLLETHDLDEIFKVDHDFNLISFLAGKGIDIPLTEWYRAALSRVCNLKLPVDSIRLLIERGADVNFCTRYHGTPLQIAAKANLPLDIIQLLVENGADINAAHVILGGTALQAAITPCDYVHHQELIASMETILFLLEKGANVNGVSSYGMTPLQGAANRGYLKIAHMLLERGADPDATHLYSFWYTALEQAAEHGRLDMVQLLLNAGARATPRVVFFAERNCHFVIADLIREEIKKKEAEARGIEEIYDSEDDFKGGFRG